MRIPIKQVPERVYGLPVQCPWRGQNGYCDQIVAETLIVPQGTVSANGTICETLITGCPKGHIVSLRKSTAGPYLVMGMCCGPPLKLPSPPEPAKHRQKGRSPNALTR